MKIKHSDIEIPNDEPFKNCKLDRKQYALILTQIVANYSDGFVLAIDSKWGTGKTTFVKMWKKMLENEGYKTLYFNAWVNDFDSNPLVAILSELKTLSTDNNPNFKSLLKKGAIITQKVFPTVIQAIAEKYIDIKPINDLLKSVSEASVEILKDEIDEYTKKKKGLLDFRESLKTYVESSTEKQPLIFIIDELDRCRPTYAVEVLEQVKHFFNVPGITFVLAIDKVQLSGAINGFYGSDKINSIEYLRRFIDIEYTIPEPTTGAFCDYLINYYQFDEFFMNRLHPDLQGEKAALLKIAKLLFGKDNTPLRQQAKILAHARLSLNMVKVNGYLFPELYFLMIYMRDTDREFYNLIKNKQLSNQELLDRLSSVFPQNLDSYVMINFIYLEADLLRYYENYVNNGYRESKLLQEVVTGSFTLMVKSSFKSEEANRTLEQALRNQISTRKLEFSLNVVLEKVDLVQQITN